MPPSLAQAGVRSSAASLESAVSFIQILMATARGSGSVTSAPVMASPSRSTPFLYFLWMKETLRTAPAEWLCRS
eukprot:7612446-Heterocapsa_arctica.AAC.1